MFYVIEISELKDKTSKAIYPYEAKEEALGVYHQKMGGAMRNENYLSELILVINEKGAISVCDYFKREIPEEPAEEETVEVEQPQATENVSTEDTDEVEE